MADLSVTMMPTDELVPYAGNAKEHPDWQVAQIVASIEEVGYYNPILAWHNSDGEPEIVSGHGRVMAAKELGISELPVIFLDYMTDEQRRVATLLDNQLTMNTGFDQATLSAELDAITGIDMSAFGFGDEEEGSGVSDGDEYEPTALAELFGFVPFSVLQTTTTDWLYRKAAWLGLGIRSEIGRGGQLLYAPSNNPSIQSSGKNLF